MTVVVMDVVVAVRKHLPCALYKHNTSNTTEVSPQDRECVKRLT